MKTITICGSMAFFDDMEKMKSILQSQGFVVYAPIKENGGVDYSKLTRDEQQKIKNYYINNHLNHIRESDSILVANYPKKGINGYVGANTFLEMGMAYTLGKKIYLLHGVPEQDNKVELLGMLPVEINGDLSLVK